MTWGQSRQCCYWFLLVLMSNGGDHSEWAFKTAIRSIWPRASVVLRHLDLLMVLSVQESSPFRFYSSFSRLGELLSPRRTSVCCVMPRPVASWLEGEYHPLGAHEMAVSVHFPFVHRATDFVTVAVLFGIILSFTITLASLGVLSFLSIEDACLPWLCSLRKTVGWTDTMDKNQSDAERGGMYL